MITQNTVTIFKRCHSKSEIRKTKPEKKGKRSYSYGCTMKADFWGNATFFAGLKPLQLHIYILYQCKFDAGKCFANLIKVKFENDQARKIPFTKSLAKNRGKEQTPFSYAVRKSVQHTGFPKAAQGNLQKLLGAPCWITWSFTFTWVHFSERL